MSKPLQNLFQEIPQQLDQERFDPLFSNGDHIRIERILSRGQSSPESGWYDQAENEWIVLVEGEAILEFKDGSSKHLKKGDHLNIPKHMQHRVLWTDPDNTTIWLAVFYN